MKESVIHPSTITTQVLFDYERLSEQDITNLCARLPRKIVRWLAIHHPDNQTRIHLYRLTGVPIGDGTVINGGVVLYDEYEGLIRFGARVAVASGVTIIASSNPNNSRLADHGFDSKRLIAKAPVRIGDDAWIGANATILPGVTIGDASVVGAGAVVTGDVAPHTIVAGVPARQIAELDS